MGLCLPHQTSPRVARIPWKSNSQSGIKMDTRKENVGVSVLRAINHLLDLKPSYLSFDLPTSSQMCKTSLLSISPHFFPNYLITQVPPLLNPCSTPLPARTDSLPQSLLLLHSPAPGPRTENSNSSNRTGDSWSPDLSRGWERGRVGERGVGSGKERDEGKGLDNGLGWAGHWGLNKGRGWDGRRGCDRDCSKGRVWALGLSKHWG